jgi:hypothetical protein
MQVTGPLINHQLKECIELGHDVLPMEDPTFLSGTWLFSDVMLLTPPPILGVVREFKKIILRSSKKTHMKFSVICHTHVSALGM